MSLTYLILTNEDHVLASIGHKKVNIVCYFSHSNWIHRHARWRQKVRSSNTRYFCPRTRLRTPYYWDDFIATSVLLLRQVTCHTTELFFTKYTITAISLLVIRNFPAYKQFFSISIKYIGDDVDVYDACVCARVNVIMCVEKFESFTLISKVSERVWFNPNNTICQYGVIWVPFKYTSRVQRCQI